VSLTILCALTAVLLWIPQNAAHEGAHCVVHKFAGDEITAFWPFPGWHRGGYFTFAHMGYRRTTPVAPVVDGFCAAAPQITNTLILLALLPLHLVRTPGWLFAVLTAWALVNFVDGAFNLGTFYYATPRKGTDGWRAAKSWGVNPWVCRGLTLVWHLGMGYHLFALLLALLAASITL
jgi:hypothetical protein